MISLPVSMSSKAPECARGFFEWVKSSLVRAVPDSCPRTRSSGIADCGRRQPLYPAVDDIDTKPASGCRNGAVS